MSASKILACLTAGALALFTLPGCGSNAPVAIPQTGASLEGAVKLGDKTLHFGIVNVEGSGGTSAQGPINQDGTYKVDNVPVGDVKIAVITDPGMARAAQMSGGMMKGLDKGASKVNVEYVDVPKKFHKTETSGLTHKTEKGPNKHDIVIK
jgi:hypothetical protein